MTQRSVASDAASGRQVQRATPSGDTARVMGRGPRLGATVVALCWVAGCGGGADRAAVPPGTTLSVAAESRAASTALPPPAQGSGTPSGPAADTHGPADVAFVTALLARERDVLALAERGVAEATDGRVRELAGTVADDLRTETATTGALVDRWATDGAGSVPDTIGSGGAVSTGTATTGVPGSGTLPARRGRAWDTAFLSRLILEARAAVALAGVEQAEGRNTEALALADAVVAGRTAQIAAVQAVLRRL
ncbi:DUF305 domain-containing protein [Nakamurella endophytica]|uniref:DUF305 domain-containing protein n=1 Tax=Nakamurella endophytica TaxID=1748367 RepID=A0A917T0K1_9ACTN|nr:DUF305 domain-containing protein [Nakamurella endophytica]GGM06206.1 hypothetical protein GCM10011594_27930 [Nakamurella endophytica]